MFHGHLPYIKRTSQRGCPRLSAWLQHSILAWGSWQPRKKLDGFTTVHPTFFVSHICWVHLRFSHTKSLPKPWLSLIPYKKLVAFCGKHSKPFISTISDQLVKLSMKSINWPPTYQQNNLGVRFQLSVSMYIHIYISTHIYIYIYIIIYIYP